MKCQCERLYYSSTVYLILKTHLCGVKLGKYGNSQSYERGSKFTPFPL